MFSGEKGVLVRRMGGEETSGRGRVICGPISTVHSTRSLAPPGLAGDPDAMGVTVRLSACP